MQGFKMRACRSLKTTMNVSMGYGYEPTPQKWAVGAIG